MRKTMIGAILMVASMSMAQTFTDVDTTKHQGKTGLKDLITVLDANFALVEAGADRNVGALTVNDSITAISTNDATTNVVVTVDGELDGETLEDDSVDNDSIDWADMTSLTTDGAIDAGAVSEAMLSTATQDKIAYITVVGADLASAGTGTLTIQLKDAGGNDLAAAALVRTWIGTADDYGVDALTDYSVSTGTSKEEVTANGEYLAITDATGLIVMAIDNGGAATNYAWAEVGGRIVASGAIVLTAP